jgi:hypothetical protein
VHSGQSTTPGRSWASHTSGRPTGHRPSTAQGSPCGPGSRAVSRCRTTASRSTSSRRRSP